MNNLKRQWFVITFMLIAAQGMAGQEPQSQQGPIGGYGTTSFNVADRLAIMNLIGAVQYHYNEQHIEEYLAVFADDIKMEILVPGSEPLQVNGKAVMKNYLMNRAVQLEQLKNKRPRVIGQVFFAELNPNTAKVFFPALLMSEIDKKEFKPVTSTLYEIDFVKQDGEWKINKFFESADTPLDRPLPPSPKE